MAFGDEESENGQQQRAGGGYKSDEEDEGIETIEDIFMDAVDDIQKASIKLNETMRNNLHVPTE